MMLSCTQVANLLPYQGITADEVENILKISGLGEVVDGQLMLNADDYEELILGGHLRWRSDSRRSRRRTAGITHIM